MIEGLLLIIAVSVVLIITVLFLIILEQKKRHMSLLKEYENFKDFHDKYIEETIRMHEYEMYEINKASNRE